jgi:hypothetical protein
MDLQESDRETAVPAAILNIKIVRLSGIDYRILTACLLLFTKYLRTFATEFTENTEREKEL